MSSWPAASTEALRRAGRHRTVLPGPPQPHGAHQRAAEKVGTGGQGTGGTEWGRGRKYGSLPTPGQQPGPHCPPLLRLHPPSLTTTSDRGPALPQETPTRGDPARHKVLPIPGVSPILDLELGSLHVQLVLKPGGLVPTEAAESGGLLTLGPAAPPRRASLGTT